MKIISFDKIKSLNIPPLLCFEWVSEVLENKSSMILPAKISLKTSTPGVFYNTMPALLPSFSIGGVKVVTRYPERKPSLESQIMLYDLTSGENIAIMDGNWITAMRTGAVAAHSIKLLAIDGFQTIGFIGLGNTARATLLVLLSIFSGRKMVIKLKKYKNQHELFAHRFMDYKNLQFEFYDTYEDVIFNSDVVVSAATVFNEDICDDKLFKEGVLVIPIHTRGFTNCDLFFDKVFADDVNHVKGFKHFEKFKSFSEMSEVVSGKCQGRSSESERILAYNIGIALHDIFFAGKIYEMINSSCTEISLNAPTDKFWV